jgi:hypothetical protein
LLLTSLRGFHEVVSQIGPSTRPLRFVEHDPVISEIYLIESLLPWSPPDEVGGSLEISLNTRLGLYPLMYDGRS